jgi:hypothetical protein
VPVHFTVYSRSKNGQGTTVTLTVAISMLAMVEMRDLKAFLESPIEKKRRTGNKK